jgi:hypothetical protein
MAFFLHGHNDVLLLLEVVVLSLFKDVSFFEHLHLLVNQVHINFLRLVHFAILVVLWLTRFVRKLRTLIVDEVLSF